MTYVHRFIAALAITSGLAPAMAEVTAQEAAALKTTLTPMGSERAGNADGSIPAWTGVYDKVPAGWKPGDRRPDPFASDKLLYSVTAANMGEHAAKLSEGTKAMLQKYPSFRVDVYPSRRTAGATQAVYDNTYKNATRAKLLPVSNGLEVKDAVAGYPFPVPKRAEEIMWNYGLSWKGVAKMAEQQDYLIVGGRPVLLSQSKLVYQWPYYDPEEPAASAAKTVVRVRVDTVGPALKAGEAIVGTIGMNNDDDKTWVYLPGQRRIRKLPRSCCDTPTPSAAGLSTFDEISVFAGKPEIFDWKILGKREILVPYNTNRLLQPTKASEVLGSKHLNPDHVRWELHRVWVLEATPAEGRRHVVKTSRYYIDEDTWMPLVAERYDGNGKLWKAMFQMLYVLPELPGLYTTTWGFNDLIADSYYVSGLLNEGATQLKEIPRFADAYFNPDAVASQGVR